MKSALHRFDQSLTKWVSTTFGQAARPFFKCMTMLGDPFAVSLVTVSIVVTGFYLTDTRLAISGALIPATLLIGAILKLLFERARPMTEYALNMRLQTFSFPSGHSSGSMITYGLLAYAAYMKLPEPWSYVVWGMLALVPLLVGLSRVYLGAHFPSDVFAGWLLGAVMLSTIVLVVRPFP